MSDVWKTILNLLSLASSIVTLFAFFSGFSSIPSLLGVAPPESITVGILPLLKLEIKIALALVAVPLFNMIDIWFTISMASIFELLHELFDIEMYYTGVIIYFLVFLPMIAGINILFLIFLFGTALSCYAIALGLASFITTATCLFVWSKDRAWGW